MGVTETVRAKPGIGPEEAQDQVRPETSPKVDDGSNPYTPFGFDLWIKQVRLALESYSQTEQPPTDEKP